MEYSDFKVCVRCITYNHSKYITDALNGFTMQQTDFPFVCCIVDDASTDGEQMVIHKYVEDNFDFSEGSCHFERETDSAITVYAQHRVNKNCFFAVSFLKENHYSIKKSKKSYIDEWIEKCEYEALCEGDDYWTYSHKLQEQVDFLAANIDYGLVYTKAEILVAEKMKFEGVWGAECSFEDILYYPSVIPTLSVCYRKHIRQNYDEFMDIQVLNNWPLGDVPLWLYFLRFSNVCFMDKVTGVYRELQESASHSKNPVRAMAFLDGAYRCRAYCAKLFWNSEYEQKVQAIRIERLINDSIGYDVCYKNLCMELLENKLYNPYLWIKCCIASNTFLRKIYRAFSKA